MEPGVARSRRAQLGAFSFNFRFQNLCFILPASIKKAGA